ncbi:unnamed protein product [Symbiodinium sp. CCMP2592]|nr:unnamed protein product [Symbiodinium sp. CCMP2592]
MLARDAGVVFPAELCQIYMRFVETDDVATFVAGLKAQAMYHIQTCAGVPGREDAFPSSVAAYVFKAFATILHSCAARDMQHATLLDDEHICSGPLQLCIDIATDLPPDKMKHHLSMNNLVSSYAMLSLEMLLRASVLFQDSLPLVSSAHVADCHMIHAICDITDRWRQAAFKVACMQTGVPWVLCMPKEALLCGAGSRRKPSQTESPSIRSTDDSLQISTWRWCTGLRLGKEGFESRTPMSVAFATRPWLMWSLAGFAASKNSIKLAAATGTLSQQDLAEPAEVDLLEDADSPKEVPFALPRVQAVAPEKLDSEAGLLSLLASDRTWTVISFVVGYAIVQYFLSSSDKASGCEAVKTD